MKGGWCPPKMAAVSDVPIRPPPPVLPYAVPRTTRRFWWPQWAGDVRWPAAALAVLAVIMCVGFPIWRVASGRESYILHLSDDSYYYFRVAPHLAAGDGPTADGVSWTTGWHPLYGFLLAGVCWLTHPSLDGLVKEAIGLNAIFYVLTGYVLYLAGRCWWGRAAGIAAALLWLSNAPSVITAAEGLETSTYVLGLALLLWRLADLVTRPRAGGAYALACLGVGVCAGLAVLGRTDSILLMPLVALILLIGGPVKPSWSARLAGVAVFSVLALAAYGAWIGYVWHYTHELHQGSAAIKMEWRKFLMRDKSAGARVGFALSIWGGYLGAAVARVAALKWVVAGVPLVMRAARGWAERGLVHLLWIGPAVLGLAYAMLLDWARAWYVAPALLTLTLLAAGAVGFFLRAPAEGGSAAFSGGALGWVQRLVRGNLGLLAWVVVLESAVVFTIAVIKEFDPDSEKFRDLRVARWLEKYVEPHARIGCWHSGIISYYSPRVNVINLDGLNNNDILPILRDGRPLNGYWDRIGLVGLIPSSDVNLKTGEVGKMGKFDWEWDHKKLVKWRDAPGFGGPVQSMDIYEQVIPQRVYRVVEQAGTPSTRPSH